MIKKENKNAVRVKRHLRVRNKVSGTAERPRLNVYRSTSNIYAQITHGIGKALAFELRCKWHFAINFKFFAAAFGNKAAVKNCVAANPVQNHNSTVCFGSPDRLRQVNH